MIRGYEVLPGVYLSNNDGALNYAWLLQEDIAAIVNATLAVRLIVLATYSTIAIPIVLLLLLFLSQNIQTSV